MNRLRLPGSAGVAALSATSADGETRGFGDPWWRRWAKTWNQSESNLLRGMKIGAIAGNVETMDASSSAKTARAHGVSVRVRRDPREAVAAFGLAVFRAFPMGK